MQMIHAACAHGQHQFDGWVIGKAFYGKYDGQEPVSFETQTQRMRQGFARLSTKGYGKGHNVVQGLELVLVRPSCADGDARGNACAGAFPGRHGCRLLRDRLEAGDGIRAAAERLPWIPLIWRASFQARCAHILFRGFKTVLKGFRRYQPYSLWRNSCCAGIVDSGAFTGPLGM